MVVRPEGCLGNRSPTVIAKGWWIPLSSGVG